MGKSKNKSRGAKPISVDGDEYPGFAEEEALPVNGGIQLGLAQLPFPEDQCHHYTEVDEVPYDLQKYFSQRYTMFSRYDEGIIMTNDAWFGLTPEPVARQIAEDYSFRTPSSKTTLIDIFAGAGGNSIAFALSGRWSTIIAIEIDAGTLACAQHNASIYGVSHLITWVHADSFEYLASPSSNISVDETVVFASPPWGGPGYTTEDVFDLTTMAPYSAQFIHERCKLMDTALFVPRTSDVRQIARLCPEGAKIEVSLSLLVRNAAD